MATVYLALGTNLGDRLGNLKAALEGLPPEVIVQAQSQIYETPAWGYKAQPPFLNMVVKAGADLAPLSLLAHLKDLEAELGRTPSFHWGPRLIDIDILFYDDQLLQAPQLTLPHPRLHERAFVLVPMADLAPDLMHPLLHQTVAELLASTDRSGVALFTEQP